MERRGSGLMVVAELVADGVVMVVLLTLLFETLVMDIGLLLEEEEEEEVFLGVGGGVPLP